MRGRDLVAPLVAAALLAGGTGRAAEEETSPGPVGVVRVVDEHGAPVPGARVALVASGPASPLGPVPLPGPVGEGWAALLEPTYGARRVELDPPVTTDAGGRAVLRSPPPDPRRSPLPGCPVWASAPGRAPAFGNPEGGETLIEIDRPADFAGRLLDGSGAPVAGARILAPYRYAWDEGPPAALVPLSATTDAEGRFRIAGMQRGEVDLRAILPSGVAFEMLRGEAPAPEGWELRLGGTGALRLRFVDDATGEPLAGVRFGLHVDHPGGFGLSLASAVGASAEDGTAVVSPLPPGMVSWVGAEREGYRPPEGLQEASGAVGAEILAGREASLVLRLKPGTPLRGRVIAGDGGPVPGALVEVARWPRVRAGRGDEGESWFMTLTGADGAYLFPGLPEGTFALSVTAPGFHQAGAASAPSREEAPPGAVVEIRGRAPMTLDLAVLRLGSVEGIVVDAAGRPVADAAVRIQGGPAADGDSPFARSDAAGAFRIEGVPPAPAWTATAVRRTGATRPVPRSAPFEVKEGETASGIRVVLPAGSTLAGVLRRADGGHVGGLRLFLASGIQAGGGGPPSAGAGRVRGAGVGREDAPKPDPIFPRPWEGLGLPGPFPVAADGNFRIEGLGASTFTLVVDTGSPWWIRGPAVALKEGEGREDLAIELPPLREVSLRVTDAAGAPLPGAQVALFRGVKREWNTAEAHLRSDGEGLCRQGGLPPGTYSVEATSPGFLPAGRVLAESAEEATLVLARGRSVDGIVVDAGTGAPLVGIQVVLRLPDGVPRPAGGDRTETGPDGRFAFRGLGEGGFDLLFEEWAGGHAARLLREVAPGTADLRVELAAGLSIGGEILGPDGKPFHGEPPPVAFALPVGEGAEAREGAERQAEWKGGFAIPGLAPGEYEVGFRPAVQGDFWCPERVRVAAGAGGVVLRAALLPRIGGRVAGPGGRGVSPGPRGALEVVPSDGSREPTEVMFPSHFTATVREDGSFETSTLDPGRRYDLRARGFPGFEDGALAGVAPGTLDVSLVLAERVVRSISGQVLDTLGQPVPAGRRVQATAVSEVPGAPSPSGEGTGGRTITDAEGRFVIAGLADHLFHVQATSSHDGDDFRRLKTESTARVRAGTEGVVLRLFRFARVTGRLVDGQGRPVAKTDIFAVPADREMRNFHGGAKTAEDGTFLLRVAPGPFRLGTKFEGKNLLVGEFEAPAADLVVSTKDLGPWK